jgi:hypothetical protein
MLAIFKLYPRLRRLLCCSISDSNVCNMGEPKRRFVAKAEAGKGWRIWNVKQKKWWGERYQDFPEKLLAELNGGKVPQRITSLIRQTARKRVTK